MTKRINLTADISKSCAFRGGTLPSILSNELSSMYSTVSTVVFSIHNGTHIDLPWLIDWTKFKQLLIDVDDKISSNTLDCDQNEVLQNFLSTYSELDISINRLELYEDELRKKQYYLEKKYHDWMVKKCLILDFSDKIKTIEPYLVNAPIPSLYLKDDIGSTELYILFDKLKITKEDIIEKINIINEQSRRDYIEENIDDKIIIFKTLWTERFLPFNTNINNQIFEGWHAFLTYPYLTYDAIKYLIDEKVAGVASDTVSLENPLCNIDVLSDNYKKYLLNLHESNSTIAPFHITFLINKKIIIENLWYLIDTQSSTGTLTIIPYPLGTRDGTIVNVIFQPD